MTALRITLNGDGMAKQLERLLSAFSEFPDLLPKIVDGFIRLLETGAAFNFDCAATAGTGELRVGFKPSERFLELLTAAGAGDRELRAVQEAFRHDESSIGASTTPMVGAAGRDRP